YVSVLVSLVDARSLGVDDARRHLWLHRVSEQLNRVALHPRAKFVRLASCCALVIGFLGPFAPRGCNIPVSGHELVLETRLHGNCDSEPIDGHEAQPSQVTPLCRENEALGASVCDQQSHPVFVENNRPGRRDDVVRWMSAWAVSRSVRTPKSPVFEAS